MLLVLERGTVALEAHTLALCNTQQTDIHTIRASYHGCVLYQI